jgi:hypothetical protein
MPSNPTAPPRGLTEAQIEIVGSFSDYSFEYRTLGFDEVAEKVLGQNPFPNTPNGRKFKAECKKVFDLERAI